MKLFALLCTAAAVSIFCACQKEDTPQAPAPAPSATLTKKAVEFNVGGFVQNVGDFRTVPGGSKTRRDSLLATKISFLFYFAYDSLGNEVRMIYQNVSDANDFGVIKDSLAPGSYTIVFMGTTDTPAGFGGSGLNDPETQNAHTPLASAGMPLRSTGVLSLYPVPNAYYKKFPLTVSSTDAPAVTNVSLERIVGKIEVNVLDAVPQNAPNETTVTINPESVFFGFGSGSSSVLPGDVISRSISRVSPTQFSELVLNTETPFSVTIKYTGYYSGLTTEKTIHNVRCYKNKRTILTGLLFDVPPGDSTATGGRFEAQVNDVWDPNDEVINF